MTDLVIRPLTAVETSLFESLTDPGLVGFAAFGDTYRAMADAGEYRPGWTWVALRGDRVVARAAWWGGPDDEQPKSLDFTDPDAAAGVPTLAARAPQLVEGRLHAGRGTGRPDRAEP